IVAAEDAVADQWPELVRDRALVLDRQVGNAAPRVELVGLGERGGRAGVEAGAAAPATVALGGIGIEREAQIDFAEKQPRPELARNQVGVLALPAEPRLLSQRLFHHRRGIDEDLELGRPLRRDPTAEPLEPLL